MVKSEEAMHDFAEHVAAVNTPKEHELVPETVYPELHVGWHVDPLARELIQLPTAPFAGAVDASHGESDVNTYADPMLASKFAPINTVSPSIDTL